jgi:glycosyltransferase involved in cell wall biosynthesis
MKTLIIAPRFHPAVGGYEHYLMKVARSLVQEGTEVTVFTTNAYDMEYFWLPEYRNIPTLGEQLDGISIRRFPIEHGKWRRRATRLLGLLPSTRLRALYWRPAFPVKDLWFALQSESFDQVHVGPLPFNFFIYAGIAAARAKKAPIIVTPATHLGPADSDIVRKEFVRRFQIDLLNRCHTVLVSTRAERDWLARLGVTPEKLSLYNLGIDIDQVSGGHARQFRTRHQISQPIILFLGTKTYEKGIFDLIGAMRTRWEAGDESRLVLAGQSTAAFYKFLQEQPAWVLERIVDLGIISHAEKVDALAAADVLALPSRVESFGFVYIEAWANRKPVIGANIPTTAEVISHGVDGLLVEFGDVNELAHALGKLLSDSTLRQKMGEEGWKKTTSHYSWNRAWQTLAPHFYADAPSPGHTVHGSRTVSRAT